MSKALVLAYPGCIMFEVMLACELVSKALPVAIATLDGKKFASSTGLVFEAQCSYTSACIDLAEYECVLIPGGDTHDVFENSDLSELLRKAVDQRQLLAAICAGPLLLAKAGVLAGKRFTHGFGEHYKDFLAPYWQTGFYVDDQVVVDQNIITAKPEAHVDFAVTVARMVGAVPDDEKAEYYRKFYKGRRLPSSAVSRSTL